MRLFLIYNNADINASQQEKFEFVMSIAKGERRYDEIVQWLTSYIVYQNV
jgi:prophage maintenance system killer protein